MKIYKLNLGIKDAIDKEWIVTNGLGGFAMSTVGGFNTRSYHGLLIASLNPPAKRRMVFSKFDESIEFLNEDNNENQKEILYSNVSKNYISQGFMNLESFSYKYYPEYEYRFEVDGNEVFVNKKIAMEYGTNTTVLEYNISKSNKPYIFNLVPLLNFRDFHGVNTPNILEDIEISNIDKDEEEALKNHLTDNLNWIEAENNDNDQALKLKELTHHKIKRAYIIDKKLPVYMNIETEGGEVSYIQNQRNFYGMEYIREQERGFSYIEDLKIPGDIQIKVEKNKELNIKIYITLDEEEKKVDNIFKEYVKRQDNLIKNAELKITKIENEKQKDLVLKNHSKEEIQDFLEDLVIASDKFVVKRDDKVSIMAGYPWFMDWGRDTLISFEGILLKTNRIEEAKELLLKYLEDLKGGLIPNGYGEYENDPYYNSSDASLLYFEAVNLFLKYTNDFEFVEKNIIDSLEYIISAYKKGTDVGSNNIYLDTDGLLHIGTEEIQSTWMDAKVGGYVVTPRNGKPVEINSLWYNAQMTLISMFEIVLKEKRKFLRELEKEEIESKIKNKIAEETIKIDHLKDKIKRLKELSEKTKTSFQIQFPNKKGGLKDLTDDEKIRPNQLFSLALTYNVIDEESELAKDILKVTKSKLLNRLGLKTLAKGSAFYVDEYSGDSFKRDSSYHQGITWPWLLILYYNAMKNRAIKLKEISNQKTKENKKEKDKKIKTKLEKEIKKLENEYIKLIKEINKFKETELKTFISVIHQKPSVGGIPELADSTFPYDGKGSPYQAWSIAAVICILTDQDNY